MAPRSSAEGARIEAPKTPSGVGCWEGVSPSLLGVGSGEGAMPPPQKFFSTFYFKRRVLVDSDVLNVPVTRTRA